LGISTRLPSIISKKCTKKLMDENMSQLTKSFLNTNATQLQEDSFILDNSNTPLESNHFIRSNSSSERNATLEPMCQEDSIMNHQVDSNSIANSSYSSYFNMLTYCSSSSTYIQHDELNVVNLVEANVHDLLNQSEDIEHDLYF
jgi:hypothetical protein